ncbi:thiolase family protein [Chloroflexota bacterium]
MGLADLKDKTAIVGVGYTPQGRVPDRSEASFLMEAAKNTIEDAGLKKEDIDGLLLQPPGTGQRQSFDLAGWMGIDTLRFAANVDMMGATGNCIAQYAAWAVALGQANYVLCLYGTNGQSGKSFPSAPFPTRGEGSEPAFGKYGAPQNYGQAARQAIHEGWTGPETWCEIAMSHRKWANLNPRATFFKKTMTQDDYFAEPWVVEPFRRADCCLVSDGARGFIVTTAERARDLKQPPVYISGMGQFHHTGDAQRSKVLAGPTGAKEAGEQALKMADITLADIDACEIYDCFTYTVEITLQSYGFFKAGEGKGFFKDNRTGPEGEFPVNTSGGLLSEAYFQAWTPLTEGVMQLRGQCGERQLKDPEFILCSGNGGTLQSHATIILRR